MTRFCLFVRANRFDTLFLYLQVFLIHFQVRLRGILDPLCHLVVQFRTLHQSMMVCFAPKRFYFRMRTYMLYRLKSFKIGTWKYFLKSFLKQSSSLSSDFSDSLSTSFSAETFFIFQIVLHNPSPQKLFSFSTLFSPAF